jgi:chemotaxis protein MotB
VSKGRRHEEHEEHEEHVNHEAWVIPYADMLTLLMCLFLVLFAIGRTDASKAKLAALSFKSQLDGTGHEILNGGVGVAPLSGGNGVLDNSGAAVPTTDMAGISPVKIAPSTSVADDVPTTTSPADRALEAEGVALAAAQSAAQSLAEIQQFLQAAADANGIGDQLGFSLEARGLVLTIVTDQVLFTAGQASLQPDGVAILDLVAAALAAIPNDISIEGHTDSRPISTARFPSNWELSTARATSVLRYLIDVHHLDPLRLSAGGYADTRPIGDNSTEAGAARNRRVEIVVLSNVSLQPVLDQAAAAPG